MHYLENLYYNWWCMQLKKLKWRVASQLYSSNFEWIKTCLRNKLDTLMIQKLFWALRHVVVQHLKCLTIMTSFFKVGSNISLTKVQFFSKFIFICLSNLRVSVKCSLAGAHFFIPSKLWISFCPSANFSNRWHRPNFSQRIGIFAFPILTQ